MFEGAYTAIVTPFARNGRVDYEGLKRLAEFQVEQGITGIVVTGTTGESPTLSWDEHKKTIEFVQEHVPSKCRVIAGTGSNSSKECMEGTSFAAKIGIDSVLLVDPYYNGPSSLEIRREYIEPIARRFPNLNIIPYVIPGRTGTQLLPQDLAILSSYFKNVNAVKEATGDIANMRMTRKLCGKGFTILSGDDDKTLTMIQDNEIRASGVISVTSNITPSAAADLVKAGISGNSNSRELHEYLSPLFGCITVKTMEQTKFGEVQVRARNPLATKTLMNILGMPSGPCRQPLGRMTKKAIEFVVGQARKTYEQHPEILEPIEEFFDVDLGERLYKAKYMDGLYYESY
ncbi:MAG: 4-hydroxy-tetrahydrodipicolinate synthase [Thaumarchaeota archaeon]|nr:4-hydroxy-tetrahydrodipicolinate synthase [Nitrososphaerota archaeon]